MTFDEPESHRMPEFGAGGQTLADSRDWKVATVLVRRIRKRVGKDQEQGNRFIPCSSIRGHDRKLTTWSVVRQTGRTFH